MNDVITLILVIIAMILVFGLGLLFRAYRMHLWRKSSPSYQMMKMMKESFNESLKQQVDKMSSSDGKKVKKPPLGLKPRWVHDQERKEKIVAAIYRYEKDGMLAPREWVEEYIDLKQREVNRLNEQNRAQETSKEE